MITLFVLMPFIALSMAINIIIGCYVFIRLGYGPPNWQTALNQVIRLTTLQYYLNEGRQWLEIKAPWTEKLLVRLHVPKPIIFIDVTIVKEEEEPLEEKGEEKNETDEPADALSEELVDNLLLPTGTPIR